MTTEVNFVCDRLPDQDGCRFIELENEKGESVGDDVGVWRSRADGLVELHVELTPPAQYTAVDMANATRDGFRDGAASLLPVLEMARSYVGFEGSDEEEAQLEAAIIAAGGRVKE